MPNIAILSDIHGNSPALRAVLEDIRPFDCEQIFVIGDIINGLDPAGCMNLLIETPNLTGIKGNAEYYLLIPDLDAFPQQNEPFYKDIIELLDWWRARLAPEHLTWLEAMPGYLFWNGWLFVHDSPEGRLYPETRYLPDVEEKYQEMFYHDKGLRHDMDDETAQKNFSLMDKHDVSGIFVGHTHEPFLRMLNNKFICNTGSVGMPLDGDPRPVWVLGDDSGNITIRRVEYHVTEALALVDNTPNYIDFKFPERADAFKKMYETGIHWRAHIPKK